MNRRHFNTALAALGITAAARASSSLHVDAIRLSRNGWVPNNDHLPVLLYRRAFNPGTGDLASTMEQAFSTNQWPPQWRNGVYNFHHYHSTAHEVLGFAAGSAELMLGGESGPSLTIEAGDVLVLPTGTGHCLLHSSHDFLTLGAYPANQQWDICRTAPDQAAQRRMATLPFPCTDPVSGIHGQLTTAWHPVAGS